MNAMQMSQAQPITDELRAWLKSQVAAGCRADDILSAMRSSGWDDAAARLALQEVQPGVAVPPEVPPVGPLPEPALADGANVIDAMGHPVRVLMTMRQPRVVVFGNLLSDAECDALIEEARPRLTRSETVVNATGGSEVNAARTSQGMFFQRGESPLIEQLESRFAALLGWPVRWGEGLQILRYAPGAEYRPHHDYFDPKHAGTEAVLRRGGQRVGTLIMYLHVPENGGGTVFPDVGLEVAPVKGHALFFSYDRPHESTGTLHGGSPVTDGEKWVATKWMREGVFG